MNNHEINMYITKFRDEMKFKNKKQGYNFKTRINEYSKRETFNLTYELFKYCVQKDKENEKLKEENEKLESDVEDFQLNMDEDISLALEELREEVEDLKELLRNTQCYWKCLMDSIPVDVNQPTKNYIDDWVKREAFTPSYANVKEYLYKKFDIN